MLGRVSWQAFCVWSWCVGKWNVADHNAGGYSGHSHLHLKMQALSLVLLKDYRALTSFYTINLWGPRNGVSFQANERNAAHAFILNEKFSLTYTSACFHYFNSWSECFISLLAIIYTTSFSYSHLTLNNFSCLFRHTSRHNLGNVGSNLPVAPWNLLPAYNTDPKSIPLSKSKYTNPN